jgi:biopolymer transport protein ExbD
LDKEVISLGVLAERVRQAMLTQEKKQVGLRMDRTLTIQDQVDVMDRLREAGVEKSDTRRRRHDSSVARLVRNRPP